MEHANDAGDQNANCKKMEADHKKSTEGGGDLSPENKTAMRNSDESSMKKSVHPTEELVMEPFSDSSTQSTPTSFNFTSSVENVKDALLRWRTKVADASKKAEDLAGNTWQHLKTAPSFTDAALGRIAQGTKLLAEGGYENIFRHTFDTDPEEELQDYFACYLSTSAGPIMGVLYVSTAKLAFCSDSALPYKADDKTAWSFYKVVVPLQQLKTVNTSSCRTNAAEKYIQLISVDNHEFWYLGFFNYDTAVQCLQNALRSNNSHMI